MDLEGLTHRIVTGEQLLLNVRNSSSCKQRRKPVEAADDLIGDQPRRDLAGPANHARHPEGALPVSVFLAAERRHRPVRPGVHVGAVVSRVEKDGVAGDAEVVERFQQFADMPVVLDHAVGIFGAGGETRLIAMLWPYMGAQMHALSRQWTGVLDGLLADPSPTWLLGGVVGLRSLATQDPARSELLPEFRVSWVVEELGLFFCVEMIQVA